jgi:transcription termination/antitermination protein NusG
MDINENEDQLQEIEPLSSDPQPVPAPEPEQEQPQGETQVVDPELLEVDQEPEEEQQEAEADMKIDAPDLGSAPLEILEELPVMEPEPEPEPKVDAEAEVESDPDLEDDFADDLIEPKIEEGQQEQADPVVIEEELLTEVVEVKTDPIVNDPYASASVYQDAAPVDPYAAASGHEDPVADDGRAWYVIHCYSGNEDKVRHNIMQRIESMSMDDLIFDVVVPTEDEVNIKNGERQTVEKKVFPGYILVYMILTEESWYMVRNTPGVTGFVGMGNDPTALQPEEVAKILKRMESESPRINVTFRTGERVRIVDGPFEDFYGKVAEIDMERATVRVMVNFFGRETPVELDFLQVEEA